MTLPPHDRDELLERIGKMGQAEAGEKAFGIHVAAAAPAGISTVHGAGQFQAASPA